MRNLLHHFTMVLLSLTCVVSYAVNLTAADSGLLKNLPTLAKSWKEKDAGTAGAHRWVHFEHTTTRDVLAVTTWHAPGQTVDHSPVRQASIEAFRHTGYASCSTAKLGQPVAEMIRYRKVAIQSATRSKTVRFSDQAIEYTFLYKPEKDQTGVMAHGYVCQVGDEVAFVQHTSRKPISSELAADMAFEILSRQHATESGRATAWSFRIDRKQP